MTQDHRDQIRRSEAAGNSRRRILQMLGVGGASGLLAVLGLEAMAADRPYERLQDRSKRRNRKQRNNNQNNNNQNTKPNNQNSNGGGGLGDIFALGSSVAFSNPTASTYTIQVIGPNGDVNFTCPPGFNATLSHSDISVEFIIRYAGAHADLYMRAYNPDVGEPYVAYEINGGCVGNCSPGPVGLASNAFSVGEIFTIPWFDGKSFQVERQSDSSDYKMFLVTALA